MVTEGLLPRSHFAPIDDTGSCRQVSRWRTGPNGTRIYEFHERVRRSAQLADSEADYVSVIGGVELKIRFSAEILVAKNALIKHSRDCQKSPPKMPSSLNLRPRSGLFWKRMAFFCERWDGGRSEHALAVLQQAAQRRPSNRRPCPRGAFSCEEIQLCMRWKCSSLAHFDDPPRSTQPMHGSSPSFPVQALGAAIAFAAAFNAGEIPGCGQCQDVAPGETDSGDVSILHHGIHANSLSMRFIVVLACCTDRALAGVWRIHNQ